MDGPFFDVRVRRDLPYPVEIAFAWLTDYQDDDPDRTDAVVKHRPVVERHPDRVVLDGTIEILGRRTQGRVEVRLFPPDRWEAYLPEGRGAYFYHLAPTPAGCRLEVLYRTRVRRPARRLLLRLARPLIRRQLRRMWDGFEASMAQDLAGTRAAGA